MVALDAEITAVALDLWGDNIYEVITNFLIVEAGNNETAGSQVTALSKRNKLFCWAADFLSLR